MRGGELVEDVTTHPAFRNAARTIATIYDRKRAPEDHDVMTFVAGTSEWRKS
jgi:4-hydroxyphenylacetate 3-monooxygenase